MVDGPILICIQVALTEFSGEKTSKFERKNCWREREKGCMCDGMDGKRRPLTCLPGSYTKLGDAVV